METARKPGHPQEGHVWSPHPGKDCNDARVGDVCKSNRSWNWVDPQRSRDQVSRKTWRYRPRTRARRQRQIFRSFPRRRVGGDATGAQADAPVQTTALNLGPTRARGCPTGTTTKGTEHTVARWRCPTSENSPRPTLRPGTLELHAAFGLTRSPSEGFKLARRERFKAKVT